METIDTRELDEPIGFGLSNPDRLEWLRTETRDGFRLDLWNTGEHREGKAQLAYRLCHEQPRHPDVWMIVFSGEDFFAGISLDLDGDQVLADILGFLALKPGEAEGEFFERREYAPWQIAFAERFGSDLAVWSSELESDRPDRRDAAEDGFWEFRATVRVFGQPNKQEAARETAEDFASEVSSEVIGCRVSIEDGEPTFEGGE
jgi:hypothetical protein